MFKKIHLKLLLLLMLQLSAAACLASESSSFTNVEKKKSILMDPNETIGIKFRDESLLLTFTSFRIIKDPHRGPPYVYIVDFDYIYTPRDSAMAKIGSSTSVSIAKSESIINGNRLIITEEHSHSIKFGKVVARWSLSSNKGLAIILSKNQSYKVYGSELPSAKSKTLKKQTTQANE